MRITLEAMVDAVWQRIFLRLHKKYIRLKYSKFRANHIFDIVVGEISFKMTFLEYSLNPAIIERIEGRRESETVAIIKALLRKGDKVVEIGGCYGYFTIIMSKCVGSTGRIVSIESLPKHLAVLKKNMEINNITNVDLNHLFIDSELTELPLPLSEAIVNFGDKTDGSVLQTKKEIPRVPAKRLSIFLREINFIPDWLFMDIESFEIGVFEDLSENYFSYKKPVIIFETHPQFYKGDKNLDYIKSILTKHNYIFRSIADNLLCIPPRM
jgi:FkbM family methyltransferase